MKAFSIIYGLVCLWVIYKVIWVYQGAVIPKVLTIGAIGVVAYVIIQTCWERPSRE